MKLMWGSWEGLSHAPIPTSYGVAYGECCKLPSEARAKPRLRIILVWFEVSK